MIRAAVAVVAALASRASPVAADPRGWHGSVGAGGSLLLTGDDGARQRIAGELDLLPGGAFDRYGILVALRDVDGDHHGLLCAGVLFEAAAARPTLALALHADVGVDLDARAPLVGGGLRTTLAIVGPLGVALDAGGELVIDGIDHTRLALATSAMLVARW